MRGLIAASTAVTVIALGAFLRERRDVVGTPADLGTIRESVDASTHVIATRHEDALMVGATFDWACSANEVYRARLQHIPPEEHCVVTSVARHAAGGSSVAYRCASIGGVESRSMSIPPPADVRRETTTRWRDNTAYSGCGPLWELDEQWTNGDIICVRSSGHYDGLDTTMQVACASLTRGIIGEVSDGGRRTCGVIPPIVKPQHREIHTRWANQTSPGHC